MKIRPHTTALHAKHRELRQARAPSDLNLTQPQREPGISNRISERQRHLSGRIVPFVNIQDHLPGRPLWIDMARIDCSTGSARHCCNLMQPIGRKARKRKPDPVTTVPSMSKRAPHPKKPQTDASAQSGQPAPSSEHPYSRVESGEYVPSDANADDWAAAKPVAVELLGADRARHPHHDKRTCVARRSALCLYLTWLAGDNPDLLDDPLDPDQIRRYLATDGMQRRSSHRSRTAIKSILNSIRGDEQPTPALPRDTTEPTSDVLFDRALAETAHFRNPVTRANTRALLLLTRGAGLDGADLRYVRGSDIQTIPGAGTWVHVKDPRYPRSVPILARYASLIEDLAAGRGDRPMLSYNGAIPIDSSTPGQLAGMITRALIRAGHPGRINVSGLRKAWIAEHISANAPLLTLMNAAGVNSLRAFEDLLTDHAPLPPTNPAHIAYELGGIHRKGAG